MAEISALADALSEALEAKREAEAALKEANAIVSKAKENLIDAMLWDEMDSVSRHGKRYSLVGKRKYSKRAGCEDALFTMLRDRGLGDIITETVNANTLNAMLNNVADDNGGQLPEDWEDCINTYEYTDVSVRKG